MIKFNDASKTRYNEYNIVGFYVDSSHRIILLGINKDECELVYGNTETMNKDIELLDKVLYTKSMEEVISCRDKEVECLRKL